MKPAGFEYHAPRTLGEAVELLHRLEDDARILAGGQSLVPMMNLRLARPEHIIDINRIAELEHISTADGALRIGALVRHNSLLTPPTDDALGRLLALVAGHIGHLPIRVRGTFAGSIAHADPASEWCLVATTLDAEMVAESSTGQRLIPASQFFLSSLSSDLKADEVLSEVRLPLLGEGACFGFEEVSRRAGDFALTMILAVLWRDGERIEKARIGIGGAANKALRAAEAEAVVVGQTPSPELWRQAAEAAAASVDPVEDIHASTAYRRDLVRALTRRALAHALA
jgi:carbon-monoxide dehydrogenase medium subunit